ncbi:MAG: hypothetical protein LBI44_06770 [Oscillospiraceae bacterium]|nr:hypothetical protein [Oscillospiraceae bacterium]
MTRQKAQAVELIRELPDEKMGLVIEILMGMRAVCPENMGADSRASHLALDIFGKYNATQLPRASGD